MTNLDSILKSRDITTPAKVRLVKVMVFPVVVYGCESWTIKKAKRWRIDAFWTVVLEKTLESPLYCKQIKPVNPKGNQSWILIWRTDAETETSILWLPDVKNRLIGKDPDAGKDWGQEGRRGRQRMRSWVALPTQWTWVWASSGSWWWTGRPGVLQSMASQSVGHDWVTEQQQRYYHHYNRWILYFVKYFFLHLLR